MFLGLKITSKVSLILTLVLMQLIAPMVHGHAGHDERADGLHVHLTEVNSTSELAKANNLMMESAASAEAMAVDMATGLKRKVSSDLAVAVLFYTLLFSLHPTTPVEPAVERVSFLFSVANLFPPERAPPVQI